MSRIAHQISQEPALREDNTDTPDTDERARKKVRWNSVEPADEDNLGESTDCDKVGSLVHSCQQPL